MLLVFFVAVAEIKFMNSHCNRLLDAESNKRCSRRQAPYFGTKTPIPRNEPVATNEVKVYSDDSFLFKHCKNAHAPLGEQGRQNFMNKRLCVRKPKQTLLILPIEDETDKRLR